MSAVTDEQEWRDGFYLGAADHRQHRPHRDEHGRAPQHRVGYEDGWKYDDHQSPQVPAGYEKRVLDADFQQYAGALNEEGGL